MLMQHVGVGYFGYYRATTYVMKHSVMPDIAKLRMKALHFWEKHGINAAVDAFGVSTRTVFSRRFFSEFRDAIVLCDVPVELCYVG
ncbi:hypothetical protein N6D94_004339 [Salmonella enterica]|nr:hypothetical protein [Salmonella enterica]EKA1852272.1 hypothetical protein [Salmonella enterica]